MWRNSAPILMVHSSGQLQKSEVSEQYLRQYTFSSLLIISLSVSDFSFPPIKVVLGSWNTVSRSYKQHVTILCYARGTFVSRQVAAPLPGD